jgi:hypothetical protein
MKPFLVRCFWRKANEFGKKPTKFGMKFYVLSVGENKWQIFRITPNAWHTKVRKIDTT